MFKISRKQTIIRASIFGSLIIAVLSLTAFFTINNHNETDASTKGGDEINVYDADNIQYWYGVTGHRWGTHHWKVKNLRDNKRYEAYCAQPDNSDPAGNTVAELLSGKAKYDYIKLLIYIFENDNSLTHDLRSSIYNGVSSDSFWESSYPAMRTYIFTHAVIGAIYDKDYEGIDEEHKNRISDTKNMLINIINPESAYYPIWEAAGSYALFRGVGAGGAQDVVWIEPTGSIIVTKTDSVTGTTPQGDGVFAGNSGGIVFVLSDGTSTIPKTLPEGATSVTFSGLDLDKTYTIIEDGGVGYNLSPAQGNITPTIAGTQVTFSNTIKKGRLKVKKIDKETQSCEVTTYGRNFGGTTIQLINRSAHPVAYNGAVYSPNVPIDTQTFAQNQCELTFENLPYGTYGVVETDSATGYVLDDMEKSVTVHPDHDGDLVEFPLENQPIRGDILITKTDSGNNNLPMANTAFNISALDENNQVMESHIVIADENGVVNTSADLINHLRLHTFNTNGYDEIFYSSEDPVTYAGYGTWFGKGSDGRILDPNDSLGALPYGTYLIEELTCDANRFCYNIVNEKMTIQITQHNQVREINWSNECAPFSIQTEATDKADGDHYIELGQETEIKDHVSFCAKKGFTFTITGTLMKKNKNTGEAEPYLIDGQPVEQSVSIKPEEDCGTVDMYFPVNTSDIAGESLVVFEKLYYKGNVKALHEDINDQNQTVDIVSLGTVAVDNSDDDKLIVPSEETVIKDTVSYCLGKTSLEHSITGTLMDKTTGNPIMIDGEPVTKTVHFLPEQKCGTIDIVFPAIDTTAIAGHPIVVFEKLAVDTPSVPDPIFEPVISHEDIDDEEQTVYPISISTTVQPNEDGTKVFPLNADITVTDVVHYCLQPGLEYTVKGVVMDKSTGNGLLVNSQPVEQSVTFTPTEYCGEFPMYYTFNTKGLTGAQLVVFESLYYDGELLIEHKDIDDEQESFEIDIEAPDTGYAAKMSTGTTETSHVELLFISVFAMTPVVIYSASHIFAKRKITFRK